MGKIKSALEIALEKTENMEINEDRIRHNTTLDQIRRIAGTYITNDEETEENLRSKLSQFNKEEIKEALTETILNSIVLPQDDTSLKEKKERIETIIDLGFHDEKVRSYYDSISDELSQYPSNKEDLINRLKEQIEPMLREKEKAMQEKYGESVHLTIESDKEAMAMVKNYIDRLNQQYNEMLSQAKNGMKELLSQYK